MEHELPKVLDGDDEPVSVEELEAVVRRAGQRRRASLVAGAAGLLLFGAVGGALARGPGDESTQGFAASRDEAQSTMPHSTMPHSTVPFPPTMAAPAMFPGYGGSLTSLFRREANGVAIRVYRGSSGMKPPHVNPACMPDTVHGELSNAAAVGLAFAPDLKSEQFLLLGAGTFGQAEGEPVLWAAVRPGTASTVRLRLGAATDAMAPQDGLAFLAVPGSSGDGIGDGVVEGLDADGKVVATQQVSALGHHPPPDPACVPPPCMSEPSGAAGVEVIPHAPPVPGMTTTVPAMPPPDLPPPPGETSFGCVSAGSPVPQTAPVPTDGPATTIASTSTTAAKAP